MNQSKPLAGGYESRTRANTIRLARWTGAWVATTALMTFGPKFLWDKATVATLLAIGLNIAIGVGMVLANKKYVEELDELQRKVYLNALAITSGVGLIVGIPFSVLDMYQVIPFRADIGSLLMIMSLTFVAATIFGSKRYK